MGAVDLRIVELQGLKKKLLGKGSSHVEVDCGGRVLARTNPGKGLNAKFEQKVSFELDDPFGCVLRFVAYNGKEVLGESSLALRDVEECGKILDRVLALSTAKGEEGHLHVRVRVNAEGSRPSTPTTGRRGSIVGRPQVQTTTTVSTPDSPRSDSSPPSSPSSSRAGAMAKRLHKAMKGLGTDEKAIYTCLKELGSNDDWWGVIITFKNDFPKFNGGDLRISLQKELSKKEMKKCFEILAERGIDFAYIPSRQPSGSLSPPPPSPPRDEATPVEADPNIRRRVNAIYKKYCPEKLLDVDVVLETYKGKEELLITKLVKKYGEEPTSEDEEGQEEPEEEKEAEEDEAVEDGKEEEGNEGQEDQGTGDADAAHPAEPVEEVGEVVDDDDTGMVEDEDAAADEGAVRGEEEHVVSQLGESHEVPASTTPEPAARKVVVSEVGEGVDEGTPNAHACERDELTDVVEKQRSQIVGLLEGSREVRAENDKLLLLLEQQDDFLKKIEQLETELEQARAAGPAGGETSRELQEQEDLLKEREAAVVQREAELDEREASVEAREQEVEDTVTQREFDLEQKAAALAQRETELERAEEEVKVANREVAKEEAERLKQCEAELLQVKADLAASKAREAELHEKADQAASRAREDDAAGKAREAELLQAKADLAASKAREAELLKAKADDAAGKVNESELLHAKADLAASKAREAELEGQLKDAMFKVAGLEEDLRRSRESEKGLTDQLAEVQAQREQQEAATQRTRSEEIASLEGALREMQAKLSTATSSLEAKAHELAASESTIKTLREEAARNKTDRHELARLQSELDARQRFTDADKAEARLQVLQEQINEQTAHLKKEMAEANEQYTAAREAQLKAQQMMEQAERLKADLAERESSVACKEEEVRIKALEEEQLQLSRIEAVQKREYDVQRREDSLDQREREAEDLRSRYEQLEADRSDLAREKSTLVARLAEVEEREAALAEKTKASESFSAELAEREGDIDRLRNTLQKKLIEAECMREQAQVLVTEADEKEKELTRLKEQVAQLERSTREVSSLRGRLKELEAKEVELGEVQVALAAREEQLEQLQERLRRREASLDERISGETGLPQTLASEARRLAALKSELEVREASLSRQERSSSASPSTSSTLRHMEEELQRRQTHLNNEADRLQQWEDELYRRENEVKDMQSEMNNHKVKLKSWEEVLARREEALVQTEHSQEQKQQQQQQYNEDDRARAAALTEEELRLRRWEVELTQREEMLEREKRVSAGRMEEELQQRWSRVREEERDLRSKTEELRELLSKLKEQQQQLKSREADATRRAEGAKEAERAAQQEMERYTQRMRQLQTREAQIESATATVESRERAVAEKTTALQAREARLKELESRRVIEAQPQKSPPRSPSHRLHREALLMRELACEKREEEIRQREKELAHALALKQRDVRAQVERIRRERQADCARKTPKAAPRTPTKKTLAAGATRRMSPVHGYDPQGISLESAVHSLTETLDTYADMLA